MKYVKYPSGGRYLEFDLPRDYHACFSYHRTEKCCISVAFWIRKGPCG